jgi:hypothetical protein
LKQEDSKLGLDGGAMRFDGAEKVVVLNLKASGNIAAVGNEIAFALEDGDEGAPAGLADGGQDFVSHPPLEGFRFGLPALEDERVKPRFRYAEHLLGAGGGI